MSDWQRIVFKVPGKAQANQRHRTTKTGHNYTPKETTEYRNWVRTCFVDAQIKSGWVYEEGPIIVQIDVFFEIPKSYQAWKVDAIKKHKYFPKKKPDCDNIAKGILDALNKIAYKDDSQVINLEVLKRFVEGDNEPCVMIRMQNRPQAESKKEMEG